MMNTHSTEQDEQLMQQALALAWQGRYSTSPNPRVGCVVVQGNQIVGQGFHVQAGSSHAEVHALRQAGSLAQGATVYVTLEPCAHYGRTPPCAEALIQAKVKRVVAAILDPNPLVAGKGMAMLKDAGIEVQSGVLAQQARQINRGFLSRIERKRPFVSLKTAVSLDGKLALANGQSQWITGSMARADVQKLRAKSCAILTGISTILADNARLNVRDFPVLRQPIRVVLDSQLRMPMDAHLIQDQQATWIFTLNADYQHFQNYPNVRIFHIESSTAQTQLPLTQVLQTLAEEGIGELLIEAGGTLNSALFAQELVDEIIWYQSPKILGGNGAIPFRLPEYPDALTTASSWQTVDLETIGDDIKWVLQHQNTLHFLNGISTHKVFCEQ